jgi:hypothetical protein
MVPVDVPPELGPETPFIDLNVKLSENVLGNLLRMHLFPVFPQYFEGHTEAARAIQSIFRRIATLALPRHLDLFRGALRRVF